jgi:hypothetical protein
MFAVGKNEYGEFGNGSCLQTYDFVEVRSQQTYKQLSAGGFHILAVDD